MGMTKSPEKCFITDKPTRDIPSSMDSIEYQVSYQNTDYIFTFHWNHSNSIFIEDNKHILKGLLINEIFQPDRKHFLNKKELEKIIKQAVVPKSPKSKLDNLLLNLYKNQEYAGSIVNLKKVGGLEFFLLKLYFKNYQEYWFFLKTLKDQNLVTFIESNTKEGNTASDIKITYQGLEYIIDIQENGENSKNCFIAMSFSDKAKETREILKKVVLETGYEPLIVDEQHYESGITINDAIINFIKKSKFIVADFTEQKHGVYFEAGFALGLKRPVIYTCSQEDFNLTHFDTNHYPHIIYSSFSELEDKLRNKIEAWIE